MKLLAKQRLLADPADDGKAKQKDTLNTQIKQKQNQVENLKRTMPSRQNKMHESPLTRNNTQQSINDTKGQILDLRRKKIGLT